jgi:hypothetical protein
MKAELTTRHVYDSICILWCEKGGEPLDPSLFRPNTAAVATTTDDYRSFTIPSDAYVIDQVSDQWLDQVCYCLRL